MHAARWCVGVALAAAACASAPKFNYYTLAVEPSESVRPALNLRVERFRTTGALGDDRIHIQASPIRVEYYATERWAATVGPSAAYRWLSSRSRSGSEATAGSPICRSSAACSATCSSIPACTTRRASTC